MPPPRYVTIHFHYASAFFLGVRFALGVTPAATEVAVFLEADLFNLALIEFLLLETPKEPFQRFPFFDFLSPFPMFQNVFSSNYKKPVVDCKMEFNNCTIVIISANGIFINIFLPLTIPMKEFSSTKITSVAKSQNIVHQYFKKRFDDFQLLVKVDPIRFKGTELTIPDKGELIVRELDFDEEIIEDLKTDGFEECSPLEFNLYLSGLARN